MNRRVASAAASLLSLALLLATTLGASAQISETKVTSGNAQLATFSAGTKGTPIVFLHAGVADSRMWQSQLETFSKTHRTIAFDRRGYGKTVYEAEDYSPLTDLAAVLDALVPGEQVILVGCSLGGMVASDFAITHPDRVKGLVLVGAAISGQPEWPLSAYSDYLQQLFAAMEAADKAKDYDRSNALDAHAWLDGPEQAEGRVKDARRDLFLDMNAIALRAKPRGKNTNTTSAHGRFGELKIPVLFVIGQYDFPDINDINTKLSGATPDAKLVKLPTAHLPSLEEPDAFNAALQDFLTAKKL